MGLIRDPEQNRVIELPGWFMMESKGVTQGRGVSSRDFSAGEGLLDERHEVFEAPFGAARPAPSTRS